MKNGETLLKIIFFLLGSFFLLGLTFVFGWPIFIGQVGNDAPNALSFIAFLDHFFPKIPLWYPLQGTGVSFTLGYFAFPMLLVVWLKHLANLSLTQSYSLVVFASVFFASFGLFCWGTFGFKKPILGFLAGIFYLLLPLSWTFIYEWGFFSETTSYAFIPFALLFFQKLLNGRRLIFLFLTVFFTGLTALSHILAFYALGVIFVLLSLSKIFSEGKRLKQLFSTTTILSFTLILVFLLFLFWFLPFVHYNFLAGREGIIDTLSPESIPSRLDFLGLALIPPADFKFVLRHVMIPPAIWIFLLMGVFLSFRQERKVFFLELLFFLWFVFAFSTGFQVDLNRQFPHLATPFVYRVFLIASRMLVPVLAGFGVVLLASFLAGEKRRKMAFLLALVLAGLFLVFMARFPQMYPGRMTVYGPGPEVFRVGFEKIYPEGKFRLPEWESSFLDRTGQALEAIPKNTWRVNFSPLLGGMVETANLKNLSLSQVSLYSGGLLLNHALWGYQQGVFFSDHPLFQNPKPLNEVASWFGIEKVATTLKEPQDRFAKSGWLKNSQVDEVTLWQNPVAQAPAVLISGPKFLVIGKLSSSAYEQLFRLATWGMIPFSSGILVEGRDNGLIDDYTLSELKKFEVVVLHGYSYRNKAKAWKLIEQYLKEGGRVFLETGWQYTVPEWETSKVPDFLPFGKLVWKNLGKTRDFKIENREIGGEIDTSRFSPLIWDDSPWGVSLPVDVRKTAKVILTAEGEPLVIAQDYGKGKVIWLGMNLPAHALSGQNQEEINFLANLFSWLGGKGVESGRKLRMKRENPDEARFILEEKMVEPSVIFFREAYHPYWQAFLGKMSLPIYRAGPGMMLIFLPPTTGTEEVVLKFRLPWFWYLALSVSLLSLLGFLTYSFWGEKVISRVQKITEKFWQEEKADLL